MEIEKKNSIWSIPQKGNGNRKKKFLRQKIQHVHARDRPNRKKLKTIIGGRKKAVQTGVSQGGRSNTFELEQRRFNGGVPP